MINFGATITAETVTFYGDAVNNGTITGNVVFEDASGNGSSGVINGPATFNNCVANQGQITGNVTNTKTCITIDPIAVDVTFLGAAPAQDRQLTYSTAAVSVPAGAPLSYQWQYTEDHGTTWQNYSNGRINYYWPPAWELDPETLPPSDAASADYFRIISGAQTNTLVVVESWANIAYRQHTKRRLVVSAPGAETAIAVTTIY